MGFVPQSHLTLTFDSVKGAGMSDDGALARLGYLVKHLNTAAGGVGFRKRWGHSYFGYLAGSEVTTNGVVHMQVAVDNVLDFGEVHHWWGRRFGFAWIRKVDVEGVEAVTRYVLKYVLKEERRRAFWLQRVRQNVSMQGGMVLVTRAAATAALSGSFA